MEVVTEIISGIFEILIGTFSISLRFVNVLLWAIAACFILPCVFVAGNIYPLWEKWAKQLKK